MRTQSEIALGVSLAVSASFARVLYSFQNVCRSPLAYPRSVVCGAMKITVTTVDSATAEFEVSGEVQNKMAAGMQRAVKYYHYTPLSLCR